MFSSETKALASARIAHLRASENSLYIPRILKIKKNGTIRNLLGNIDIPFFFDSLSVGEEERKRVFIWKCFYNVMSSKHKGLNSLM